MRSGSNLRCARPLATALVLLLPGAVIAREDASGLCLDAASRAAARTGVPYDVLLAIALVESGREDRPWPWTVNQGGDGRWFDTEGEAEAHVESIVQQGVTNVDLGCFQLNYRWHSARFDTVADMLDPDQNATYAARFLSEHYARTGDWAAAAAAYHSATPEHATAYRARFETTYAGLGGVADPVATPSEVDPLPAARENRFPLLLAGAAGSRGSLVPTMGGGARLIGEP